MPAYVSYDAVVCMYSHPKQHVANRCFVLETELRQSALQISESRALASRSAAVNLIRTAFVRRTPSRAGGYQARSVATHSVATLNSDAGIAVSDAVSFVSVYTAGLTCISRMRSVAHYRSGCRHPRIGCVAIAGWKTRGGRDGEHWSENGIAPRNRCEPIGSDSARPSIGRLSTSRTHGCM